MSLDTTQTTNEKIVTAEPVASPFNHTSVGIDQGTIVTVTAVSQPTIISSAPTVTSSVTQSTGQAHRQRPVNGRWVDSICDWPSNLFPSCWCTCCCCYGMYLVSQMSEKTGFAKFNVVAGSYLFLWLISFIFELVFLGSSVLVWLPLAFAFIMSIVLRVHIVRTQGIRECSDNPSCNIVGEICCGFWCWYCSVAQMARHLYGYTKVLDGDADIYRPDNYDISNVV